MGAWGWSLRSTIAPLKLELPYIAIVMTRITTTIGILPNDENYNDDKNYNDNENYSDNKNDIYLAI